MHSLILIYEWGLELAIISDIMTSILFAKILVCKHDKLCLTSMLLQGVIPPHSSLEKERNQPGNPVKLIQMLLKHLCLLQIIDFSC